MRSGLVRIMATLVLVAALAPAASAESAPGSILVRAGVGLDVIDFGLAAGLGAGYRFRAGPGTAEALVDAYYSPYWETYTAGSNTFNYSTTLVVVAVRANWLFNFPAASRGLYEIVGTGFFVGSYSWVNYNVTTDYTEGNDYVASGTILNLGLGYAFGPRLEARVEVPVMVFFGAYGTASAIAIPITAGILLRF
jgi:hypothetical protein